MPKLKLTEQSAKTLPVVDGTDTFYFDTDLKGFGLKVTASGSRSWFIEARIRKGLPAKRRKLGDASVLNAKEARERARKDLAQMVMGFDPVEQRKAVEQAGVTLSKALEARILAKGLKDGTAYGYRNIVQTALADWQDRPLSTITDQMAVDRHKELTVKHGPAYANRAMRTFSSAFNHAKYQNGLGADNPVTRLRVGRGFNRIKARETFVKDKQLRPFLVTLLNLERSKGLAYEGAGDLIRLLLLTGFRLNEAQSLPWSAVDLDAKSIRLTDTKNGRALVMPCCEALVALLKRRTHSNRDKSEWVFPTGGEGHYSNLGRCDLLTVVRETAERMKQPFDISAHDLRRTFATYLRALGQPELVIAGLLNHSKQNVTQGYALPLNSALHGVVNEYQSYLEKLLTPVTKKGGYVLQERLFTPANILSGAASQL